MITSLTALKITNIVQNAIKGWKIKYYSYYVSKLIKLHLLSKEDLEKIAVVSVTFYYSSQQRGSGFLKILSLLRYNGLQKFVFDFLGSFFMKGVNII